MNAPYNSRDFRPALPDASYREAPNNIEAEQALLGAILVNNGAYHAVSAGLSAAMFYEPLHRKIYDVAGELIKLGKMASPVTIKDFLPASDKIGDMTVSQYLARLAAEAVTVINAPDYAKAIYDLAIRRAMIVLGEDMADAAYSLPADVSPRQEIEKAQAKLFELGAKQGRAGRLDTADGAGERLLSTQVSEKLPTVPMPLPQMSEVMGGDLEAGNLYGMLSSSGEGKTSLVLQMMEHAARHGHPALFLSYDQNADQCMRQMVSQRIGIEASRLKDINRLQTREVERYFDAVQLLRKTPMVFKKCSGRTDGSAQLAGYAAHFLTSFAPRWEKTPIIFLDHVRKVKPKNEKDHEGRIAAEVNGVCKDIADEFNAVWVNLNQRNTFGMRRKNPRPIASDVFGGEQGVEDYDGIFYLYRAIKYWRNQLATAEDAKDEDRINARFNREKWQENEAEIGALKVRFASPTQRFRIEFQAEFTRYVSKRPEPVEGLPFGEVA